MNFNNTYMNIVNNRNSKLSFKSNVNNSQSRETSFEKAEEEKRKKSIAKEKTKKLLENPLVSIGIFSAVLSLLLVSCKGINKNLAKDYHDTFIGKLGDLGDNITDKFNKFIKKHKSLDDIHSKLSNSYEKTKTKVVNWAKNNSVLSCFMPGKRSVAEFSMAKSYEGGVPTQFIFEADDMLETLASVQHNKQGKSIDEAFGSLIRSLGTKKHNPNKPKFANYMELREKAQQNPGKYAKYYDELFEKIKQNPEYANTKVFKGGMYKNVVLGGRYVEVYSNGIAHLEFEKAEGIFAKVKNIFQLAIQKITRRDMYIEGTQNKLRAATQNKKVYSDLHKSSLGRGLSKSALFITENFTNGTAGGICSMAMQAMIWQGIIKSVIGAEEGEKKKVLAENVVTDLGMFMLMPFAIKAVGMMGGLKNIGRTTEQVKATKKLIKEHNIHQLSGELIKKSDYDASRKAIKSMFNKDVKLKFWQYPIQWFGTIIDWGRSRIRPYTAPMPQQAGFLGRLSSDLKNGFKTLILWTIPGVVGGVGRGFIGSKINSKLGETLATVPHAIVGKPKDSIYSSNDNNQLSEEDSKQVQLYLKEKLEANPEVYLIIKQQPEIYHAIEQNPTLLFSLIDMVEEEKANLKIQKQQYQAQQEYLASKAPTSEYLNNLSKNKKSRPAKILNTNGNNNIDSKQPAFSGSNKLDSNINTIDNSEDSSEKIEDREALRTYIPNPYSNIKNKPGTTTEEVEKALRKAQAAENIAQTYLR